MARNQIVTVLVGPEHQEFKVHRALLIGHSEYFKKALTKPWNHQHEALILLDNVEPQICELNSCTLDYLADHDS